MALWICSGCTAAYAVGLAACPQCGGTEYEQEYEHMAKITMDGPSYEPGKDPNQVDAEPAEADAQEPAEPEQGAALISQPGPEPTDLPAGDAVAAPPPLPPGA